MKAEEKGLFHGLNIVNEEGTGDTKWFWSHASAHLSREAALRKGQAAEANQATGERCPGLGSEAARCTHEGAGALHPHGPGRRPSLATS